jgi:hypothetical protein
MSLLIREFVVKHETTVVPQPPYSPDLVPADFFLFPKLKSTLKGSDNRRARRKFATGRVPELEKTLEAVYRQWRGVL